MIPTEAIVSTLIGHRDIGTGLICLGSLAKHSCGSVRFQIHEDGSLTDEDREQLARQLPVHSFVPREHADARVSEWLSRYPHCREYRNSNILGLKLFDAPLLAAAENLAFCDTDIFFLRPFTNLFSWPDAESGCLFMQDYQNAYALRPWHLALQSSFTLPVNLNSGLFLFRRRQYDLDFVEWLLGRYPAPFAARLFWVEQTCWAALAARSNGHFWSEQQIRVVQGESSLTDDLIAAHFVTPVRGLLPQAAARKHLDNTPVQISTQPMNQLHSLPFLKEQAVQFMQRKLGRLR